MRLSNERPHKLLVVHPGATFSTADTYFGMIDALRAQGVALVEFRLDGRIEFWHRYLHVLWRQMRKARPERHWPEPNVRDVIEHCTDGLIERALDKRCDAILVVTAMFVTPNILILARRAGLRVLLLCTESPYNLTDELRIAALADGVWTNERTAVAPFAGVCPQAAYLPCAWRAGVHDAPQITGQAVASHDVVFVGTYFAERVAMLEAVNWDGIDLGLYGQVDLIPETSPLQRFVRGGVKPNAVAASLYRRAKVGLNLFRTTPEGLPAAESLGPRSYELAACGACVLSEYRAEVVERFGAEMPTFRTAQELEQGLRALLADPERRAVVAAQAQAAVLDDTWTRRVEQMRQDLDRWTLAWRERQLVLGIA